MKTAIIGLPMTGKTSLFTILTGVHLETRIGSTSAHTGIARVPDARRGNQCGGARFQVHGVKLPVEQRVQQEGEGAAHSVE